MSRSSSISLASLLMLGVAAPAWAQTMAVVDGPGSVKWGPAPPVLPKGAEIAVLTGDPSKDGFYVLRLRMPENYRIPAHHHPTAENVTILSGDFHAGMGDTLDQQKGKSFAPGGFISVPPGMNHFAWTSEPTVIQVDGTGPFVIVYVNPEDDPSKAH